MGDPDIVKVVTEADSAEREQPSATLDPSRRGRLRSVPPTGAAASSHDIHDLVGASPEMCEVRAMVQKLAACGASSILVTGESGTGKSLVARVIHENGHRHAKPFMEIACNSLSEALIESEFFGHERGAFTDAKSLKRGLFELADGGTVFLDEIGDMPLRSQARLLRALEERAFKRVGGTEDHWVDVQVIAATNRDLVAEVKRGSFRQDLYYRLAVLTVELPPLRRRRGDIALLTEHFISVYNERFGRSVSGVADEVMKRLYRHCWPGNLRELRNVIERAMVLEDRDELLIEDLPSSMGITDGVGLDADVFDIKSDCFSLERLEHHLIHEALRLAAGNRRRAAEILGISRDALRYRMKKHQIAG